MRSKETRVELSKEKSSGIGMSGTKMSTVPGGDSSPRDRSKTVCLKNWN